VEIPPENRKRDGCNARLTFQRKDHWVEVCDREAIDPSTESFTHISMHVFREMAVWACAILGSARVVKLESGETITVPATQIEWDVYWRADDGDHLRGNAWAVCERRACEQVALMRIELDNMIALPAKRRQINISLARTRVPAPGRQLALFPASAVGML